MVAAKKAGMKCVGLVAKDKKKKVYPADLVVEKLGDISFEKPPFFSVFPE